VARGQEETGEADGRWVINRPLARFAAYGLIGWCAEVACTGLHDFGRTRHPRLLARSSLWMFPIYGLMQPLYGPLHDDGLVLPDYFPLWAAAGLAMERVHDRLTGR
jgi:hypothetical protein